MRLKSLEIAGFKSFADRVTIDLTSDVTCLVGPNGCGKSNIVDAIKWVLGEQRVTALRGDHMQDVIFKGNASGRRPPMNFAEVSLTIDNESGGLAVDFDEVVVTRRLFRSGESEYLLNRAPVRLKDVRKLFLNTGMGVGAYSIMEQGKIDGILEANPRDRRAVFEEAAGVSLLRVQRREAERKLERTAANLLRLGDIIEELEKRIRSLKNQAGRARSYARLKERLGELKRAYFRSLYKELDARLGDLRGKTASAVAGEEEVRERLAAQREKCDALAAELQVAREGLHSKRSRLGELRTALSECDGKISLMEKRRVEIESESAENKRRDEEIRRLLAGREGELRDARGVLAGMAGKEEALCREEEKIRSLAAAAGERLSECRARIEDLENDIVDLSRKEVEVGNKMVEASVRLRGLHAARFRIVGKQHAVAAELYECRAKGADLRRSLERGERKFAAMNRDLDAGRGNIRAEEALAAGIGEDVRRKEEKLVKNQSRVELLESLIERREGVAAGARAVMEEAAGENARLGFVMGMLGERLDVDVQDSRALEAVMGDLAEAIVVRTGKERAEVLAFLEERNLGGVILLALSDFHALGKPDHGLPEEGSIARRIRCDPELRPLVNALAGEILLVKDSVVEPAGSFPEEESAEGASDARPRVNDRGDFFRKGILKVGGGQGEMGVIARRSELAALRKEIEADARELDDLKKSLAGVEERIGILRSANEILAGKVDEEEFNLAALNAEKQRMIDRMNRLFKELAVLLEEGFDVEKGISSLAGEAGDLEKERETIGAALRGRSKDLDIANTRAEGYRLECSRYEAALKELEIALVEQRGKREGLERERSHLEKDVAEFTKRLDELRLDRERLESFLDEVNKEISRLKERTGRMASEISDLAAEVEKENERVGGLNSEFERESARAAAVEEEFESCRKGLEELRMAVKEVEVKQQGLRERALEEIETDLSALVAGDESPSDSPVDLEAVEEEIREVRTRIARIGNVNLEAVAELDQVETRYRLLSGQRDDLIKAEKSLKEMIRDLKAEARKRFIDTFEEVRSHFGGIFRKLFHGGRADIRLCGDEDVLDAGVEIIAGPPRKDVRSISLLSGGERSLTAVALLFALFKARPSPFCLLDEVDAALDETNIDRFCSLLGEFLGDSQFMIITHSKRTMSRGDIIYGLTMEVSGVSKVVSLKLDDYQEQVA